MIENPTRYFAYLSTDRRDVIARNKTHGLQTASCFVGKICLRAGKTEKADAFPCYWLSLGRQARSVSWGFLVALTANKSTELDFIARNEDCSIFTK